MDASAIIATLRRHQPELNAAGLLHLRLFGSAARGDNTPQSDVDLLFESDATDFKSILRAYGFQDELSALIGLKAHLSCATYMRPEIREAVSSELIDVF